jgi:cysteine synthase
MIYRNTLDLVGNTPLIELNNIGNKTGKIFAKAEFLNPGGSVKDRPALQIIKDAYKKGKLIKGQSVVEMTSGNMGAGLAIVCNVMGNPFTAVMSEGNSLARAKMLRALGANVILTKQIDGSPGNVTGEDIQFATKEATKISKETGAFYVDQFNNNSSITAHFNTTGPEIYNDLTKEVDCFIAAIGSGGTFIGTSNYLKSQLPKVKCLAVEPEGVEIHAGKKITNPKHNMQGIGYGFIVPHWDASIVDGFISVSSKEAEKYRKLLAEKEGLFVGYSAAANVCASVKLISSHKLNNPVIVTILCDSGMKY